MQRLEQRISTGIEELKWANIFALIINSSIFEDDRRLNCNCSENVHAKKYFTPNFFEEHLDRCGALRVC